VVLPADRGTAEPVHHTAHVTSFDTATLIAEIDVEGHHYTIQTQSRLGDILMIGTCNGRPFTAQVERNAARSPLAVRVSHNGAQIDTLVLSPSAAELYKLMPRKAPPDLSKFLLSPMPGLLADISVQPGQKVLTGERLAVIEAMKMENILTAAQDGTVAELLARKGESVAVDQPILSFT
jgi:propionyl-CoA carboxylase alpha chain